MINALDSLEDFLILCNIDTEDNALIEEEIVYLYLGFKLKPLKEYFPDKAINIVANKIAQNYFNKNLSIDYMVNALYNYINENSTMPSENLLNDDIETLLTDYTEEY